MTDQPFTSDQMQALGAKLAGIDFTDEERAMVLAIFRAAAGGDEVEGFDKQVVLTPAQRTALLKGWDPNSMWPPSGPPAGITPPPKH